MKLTRPLLLLCAAASAFLSSCQKAEDRADLVFINGSEPQTLDPAQISGQNEMRISSAMFEGLMRYNEQGRAEPGLAENYEVSPDGLKYTFKLREGLKWSDGTPLTTEDFLYSLQRVLDPATASDYANILFFIENAEAFNHGDTKDFSQVGVKALDPRTLEITLKNSTPFFIELCAFLTFAPTPKAAIESSGKMWTRPENILVNGPYLLETWSIDDRIRLRRNPLYWDAENVKLGTVDVLAIKDSNTAINYFLTGEADLMMDKSQIPASLVDKLPSQKWFHSSNILATYFVRFNTTKPPFNDARVRQALCLATDKAYLVKNITRMNEPVANSFTPPGAGGGYQPPQRRLDYDPVRARKLLEEAGFPDGKGFPTIQYLYNEKDIDRNIAVELQDMWKRHLGINVQLRKEEWRTYLDSLARLDYDVCRSSWVGDYDDPNTFLQIFTSNDGNNRTGWKSVSYDEAIAAAARENDPVKRFDILRAAEEQLVDKDTVILPIYHNVSMQFYHGSKIGGISGNLLDVHPFWTMFLKHARR